MTRKTRRERMTEATYQEIKSTAQRLMQQRGTAGLSIRAIAREMDMTPPAIYHYFPSLDDLITTLIVDSLTAFNQALTDACQAAIEAGKATSEQLLAVSVAFWQWAVDHPINFQLIYGNPIPGYHAPEEITQPLAQAVGASALEVLRNRLDTLDLPPELRDIPPDIQEHYAVRLNTNDPETILAYHVLNTAWISLFGLAMLHINNHLEPVVGYPDAFFEHQVRLLLRKLGLDL